MRCTVAIFGQAVKQTRSYYCIRIKSTVVSLKCIYIRDIAMYTLFVCLDFRALVVPVDAIVVL